MSFTCSRTARSHSPARARKRRLPRSSRICISESKRMSAETRHKRLTLGEAVALVHAGDTLGIGGMTLYRKPMAFVRELARCGTKDVTLLGFTSAFDAELLAAAGVIGTIRSCYFGLEFFGLAPRLRRATEEGRIRIVEETEYSIAIGLQATLMHVPYLPS